MSDARSLVLDANILLRAIFGRHVPRLLDTYQDAVGFCAPEVCFSEARRYIPEIAAGRRVDPVSSYSTLDRLAEIVEAVESTEYEEYETAARQRIDYRDPDDWPILATALLLACPIWTEDQDFFGTGVATWNTRTVKLYLEGD
jgi:predicted nucleic acid-binding protein